ncbi:hypothetical protein KY284_032620 [Solanum tuberosum]|nr:hypothetical protein KY284_032620 [Solanum tuberosum]
MNPVEGGYMTRNPFAWMREAISSSETDIINMSGVDTAVYFVFLATALGIFVFSGIVLLPVLLPVAATDHTIRAVNTTSKGTFNELDKLSMGQVGNSGARLWAFIVATYWVSIVSYFFLWRAYKHVAELRAKALMSPEVRADQFAILVRDIPSVSEGQSKKEQIDSYFSAIYPETFYRSMVVTDNKKVNKIYEELEGYKKKLERAEAIYAESKNTNPDALKPSHKTGFLGIIGEKVDSIEMLGLELSVAEKKYLCKTEAEIKEAWAPDDLGYATRFPNDMLIMTIVLCYSVIAPIIIPFGVAYFGLGWLLLRNQALKVYVPSFESYGRMWPHIYTRMIATLILYQVTMLGYFGVKKFKPTPVLFPLPIISLIFAFICQKKFRRFFISPALEVVSHELKEVPNMEIVYRSFIPPCLSAGKPDEDQFEDALSHVSKPGSSSV